MFCDSLDGGPPPPAAAPKADGDSLLYIFEGSWKKLVGAWSLVNWVFGDAASKIGKLELTSLFMNWSFLFCMKLGF